MHKPGIFKHLLMVIGATAFWIGTILLTALILVPMWCTFILPVRWRYKVAVGWNTTVVWWLKQTCGLGFRIEGMENIPEGSYVVLSNHQSTWETFAFFFIFHPTSYVIKQELNRVPIFGWAITPLHFIGINRGGGKQALKQVLEQGKRCQSYGLNITVFPEGTRTAPGIDRPYKKGGAILARSLKAPVVPVAHNAGTFWPRHSYVKQPGVITVRIGTPIDTSGLSVDEINAQVKDWINIQVTDMTQSTTDVGAEN